MNAMKKWASPSEYINMSLNTLDCMKSSGFLVDFKYLYGDSLFAFSLRNVHKANKWSMSKQIDNQGLKILVLNMCPNLTCHNVVK